MKIVKIMGGLGNQLFQYSFGKALASRSSTVVKYDLSWFKSGADYDHDILYLDHFDVEYKKVTKKEVESIFLAGETGKKFAERIYSFCPTVSQYIFNYYKEIDYNTNMKFKSGPYRLNFFPDIYQISGDAYFSGYWQAYPYVDSIKTQLIEDLTIKTPPSMENQKTLKKIKSTNSVSVHIRRGDYVKLDRTIDKKFYDKSMNIIESLVEQPHYYIFSDDIEWVKSELSVNGNFTYVDDNSVKTAYEDLRLMSACQHNIIANSTFSWWGAWLNENEDKTVLAPNMWVEKNENNIDILPKSWKKVQF